MLGRCPGATGGARAASRVGPARWLLLTWVLRVQGARLTEEDVEGVRAYQVLADLGELSHPSELCRQDCPTRFINDEADFAAAVMDPTVCCLLVQQPRIVFTEAFWAPGGAFFTQHGRDGCIRLGPPFCSWQIFNRTKILAPAPGLQERPVIVQEVAANIYGFRFTKAPAADVRAFKGRCRSRHLAGTFIAAVAIVNSFNVDLLNVQPEDLSHMLELRGFISTLLPLGGYLGLKPDDRGSVELRELYGRCYTLHPIMHTESDNLYFYLDSLESEQSILGVNFTHKDLLHDPKPHVSILNGKMLCCDGPKGKEHPECALVPDPPPPAQDEVRLRHDGRVFSITIGPHSHASASSVCSGALSPQFRSAEEYYGVLPNLFQDGRAIITDQGYPVSAINGKEHGMAVWSTARFDDSVHKDWEYPDDQLSEGEVDRGYIERGPHRDLLPRPPSSPDAACLAIDVKSLLMVPVDCNMRLRVLCVQTDAGVPSVLGTTSASEEPGNNKGNGFNQGRPPAFLIGAVAICVIVMGGIAFGKYMCPRLSCEDAFNAMLFRRESADKDGNTGDTRTEMVVLEVGNSASSSMESFANDQAVREAWQMEMPLLPGVVLYPGPMLLESGLAVSKTDSTWSVIAPLAKTANNSLEHGSGQTRLLRSMRELMRETKEPQEAMRLAAEECLMLSAPKDLRRARDECKQLLNLYQLELSIIVSKKTASTLKRAHVCLSSFGQTPITSVREESQVGNVNWEAALNLELLDKRVTQSMCAATRTDLQTADACAPTPPSPEPCLMASSSPSPVSQDDAVQESPSPHLLGRVVCSPSGARYHCVSLVGAGSHGVCYLGKELCGDAAKGEESLYAVKVAKYSTGGADSSFKQEAELMICLQHPHLVSLKEVFKWEGRWVLVMDYCQLRDLQKAVECSRHEGLHLPEEFVAKIIIQLTLALKFMHSRNYVHRDVKLANVFITSTQDFKLGDFGTSRLLDGPTSTLTGTPTCMAPEVFSRKPYSFPSDIWSLGALVYELLTLHPLFNSKTLRDLMEERWSSLDDPPDTFLKGVKENLGYSGELVVDLLSQMLAPVPENRITASEILMHPFLAPHLQTLILRKYEFAERLDRAIPDGVAAHTF